MKKWYAFIFFALLLSCFTTTHSFKAAATEAVNMDIGIIVENRTLVPLRSIFEEMGAVVNYDNQTKRITATKEGRTITLTVNSQHANVNGKAVVIDVPAKIYEGSTFVPLRFIGEAFLADVGWDQQSKMATILSSEKEIIIIAHPLYQWNGQNFVYEGELRNGVPHGQGVGIKGVSLYGDILHDGEWNNGEPVFEEIVERDEEQTESGDTFLGIEIIKGMTAQEVYSLLGEPNSIQDPTNGAPPAILDFLPNTYQWNYEYVEKDSYTGLVTYAEVMAILFLDDVVDTILVNRYP